MNPLTYLFPVAAAVFVLAFFLLGLRGENLDRPGKKSRVSKPVPASVAKRGGGILGIVLLTAVYAAVAFSNLGDTSSPEHYAALETGSTMEITFAQEVDLGRIFYFAGLNTGEITVYAGPIGAETAIGTMPHAYRDVFKWRDAELDEGTHLVTRLVLTAQNDREEPVEIGEMAFLLNDRRTATIMAIGNCKLIKVPKTAFLSLIRKNPHYGIFLSKMLAKRLALQSQNAYVIQEKLDAVQNVLQNTMLDNKKNF